MCTKKWNADYDYLLTLFDIPPLEHRRLCLSLCTTYKIINKLVDFSQHIFVSKSTSNLRSSKNTSLLLQPFARTIAYQFSYVPHSYSVWNTLPKHITDSQSLAALKSYFLDIFYHYSKVLIYHYYCYCYCYFWGYTLY